MDKLPKSLPKALREHTEQLIKKGGLGSLEPLLIRLVTDADMEGVWSKLSDKTTDPQKLVDFLEFVRLHSALQVEHRESISIPSDKLQRKAFKNVSDLSKRMISELGKLNSISNPESAWSLLETALKRAELNEVSQTSKTAFLKIKSLQNRLNDVQQHETIVSILELIASVAEYASTAPDTALPKRRNSKGAQSNYLILDLKKYLKLHFKVESHQLIADIVNTAFNSADGGVTADDVRKLKS